ncbi:cutinase family protein [Mycolicibacterium mengxianglii]|uniref:cutinase family protein n=1 Tax=Mycolicibacterium mengxianglii TaxID=2736649 RepID=UPI003556F488
MGHFCHRRTSWNIGTRGHRRTTRVVAATCAVIFAAALMTVAPVLSTRLPQAAAVSCPEVEVVFARGREEPAGAGIVGTAFVNALRAKSSKKIGYYAVNYDANIGVDQGANDMSAHIQYMVPNCPNTRLVLGGYSLGAAVTDMVLAVPGPVLGFKNPLPVGSDGHVAAVALFGNGTRKVLGGSISNIVAGYQDKIIDLCNASDPVCSPSMDIQTWADNWTDHLQNAYIKSGMVDQAAQFAAARL